MTGSAAPDPARSWPEGIASLGNFSIDGRHAGAAAPSFGGQKIGNSAGERFGLIEVGYMPSAGKLDVTRAGQRLVELAHGRRGGILLADQKQDRMLHRCDRRGIVVVGERRRASDEPICR